MVSDDPDLDAFERVPAVLQPALRLYGNSRSLEIICALADELGISTKQATAATFDLIHGLITPIADVLERGHRFGQDKPLGLCKVAVDKLSLDQTIQALVDS